MRRRCLTILLLLGCSLLAVPTVPANAAGPNEYSAPDWWPLRGSNLVGCSRNSPGSICGGNYHPVWAIDVQAPEGQPIYASGSGLAKVYSNSTACSGYGRSVVVEHGGSTKSLYAHMSNFSSALNGSPGGVWVDHNSVIGYVGHTGNVSNCTYNHLHYEETTNGSFWASATDPGALRGCIGGSLVHYPNHWGYGSWNGLPAHSLTARHDGTGCAGANPIGHFDVGDSPTAGAVRVGGWAFDADDRAAALEMHVYVGGQAGHAGAEGHAFVADKPRPDVNAAYPGVGDNHGLQETFATGKRGSQPVCLYAINRGPGGNVLLGCKTVTIGDPDPRGFYDGARSPAAGAIHVTGWSFDPNEPTTATDMHVYVGGAAGHAGAEGHSFRADKARPDVHRAYPGVGDDHGLDTTFETAKRGSTAVCLYAINRSFGANVFLGCKTVEVADPMPVGAYETAVSEAGGTVRIAGWGADPNEPDAKLEMQVTIGGRRDEPGVETHVVEAVIPRDGAPGARGLDVTIGTRQRGAVDVCLYVRNRGPGSDVLLGCKPVVVTEPPPKQVDPSPPSVAVPPPSGAKTPARARRASFTIRLARKHCVRARLRVVQRGATVIRARRLRGRRCAVTLRLTGSRRSFRLAVRRGGRTVSLRYVLRVPR